MKIGIICGSHRQASESERVAHYMLDELKKNALCRETWLFSLANNPLPLWSPDVWDKSSPYHVQLHDLSVQLKDSDGFVVIVPEWHGMVPAGLKNFFLFWTKQEMAHKPAMLVAVSAGMGGAYPIAEMRMSSYKNQFLCYIPDHIIIRHVGNMLFSGAISQANQEEQKMRTRIVYTLDMLCQYAKALRQVRNSGAWDAQRYNSGM